MELTKLSNRRRLPALAQSEMCYVCGKNINTGIDYGFSSTIRHGGERKFFHLDCALNGDPISHHEVEAEFAKYQH